MGSGLAPGTNVDALFFLFHQIIVSVMWTELIINCKACSALGRGKNYGKLEHDLRKFWWGNLSTLVAG
jgi:hypothetical protein